MPRNMTARQNAIATGCKTYETGIPCKQGHLAPRATLTGTCVECTRLASLAWLAKNPDKAAAYTSAYRTRNPELVRAKDREAKQALRKHQPEKVREAGKRAYVKRVTAEGREVHPNGVFPIAGFLSRLVDVHRGAIQYVSGYTKISANAEFKCVTHGAHFISTPHAVLRGANPCTRCNHTKSSGEEEVAQFLETFTTVVRRDRTLVKPKELDIYVPGAQLAVEYCGEFYHSHATAADEQANKNKHAQKYQACRDKGVHLITLYESEWKARKPVIKRLLRYAVGAGRGSLMARKCDVSRVSSDEARQFYERYHIQGGNGAGEHYGLYWNGKLVACMRFTYGANDRGPHASRSWTLSRYATRVTVRGGASRLFKAFLADYQPTEVKSFSDNRFFDGGMYEKLGFVLERELAPDYAVWSPKLGLLPKTQYQRKFIQKRLEEHGLTDIFNADTDPRTESDMTYLMGARRIFDCGKRRWVWKLDTPQTT